MYDDFRAKTLWEQFDIAKKICLCVLCLLVGHSVSNCPNSASKFKCSCREPHNYLLHFGAPNQKKEEKMSSSSSPLSVESKNSDEILDEKLPAEKTKSTFSCLSFEAGNELVLLLSAIVRFQCGEKSGFARILLDSCSQPLLVSDVSVRKFKIPCHE